MLPRRVPIAFICLLLTIFFSGKVRVRITDFQSFLCGSKEKMGLLQRLDLPYAKVDYSEDWLRQYTHFLGFGYSETSSGAFNDEHESESNRKDRHERFLPLHFDAFARGISHFNYKGNTLGVDDRLEDEDCNDLTEARTTMITVEDLAGNVFDIDIGGIVPEGDADVPILISHDEACFGAGEFESKVSAL